MGDYHENPRKRVTKTPTCVETGECRAPRRGGKNTRVWCKGHVGVPHTWEWQRRRDDIEREQRFNITYNRITEVPVCFGCSKIDYRYRHYCAQCGEPWSNLPIVLHEVDRACSRCGAPWMVRHSTARLQWSPSGSVTR